MQLVEDGLHVSDALAVPAHIAELMLTLPQTELASLPDSDYRIGPALTDGPLTGRQAGNLVANNVST